MLAQGTHARGSHTAVWNGMGGRAAAPPGLYFVKYEAAGRRTTARLALTR